MKTTIADWRSQIDAIDDELLRLLNQRAEIVSQVAKLKQEQNAPVCDPERERKLMNNLRESNTGPLDEQALVAIFRTIIDESRRTQSALRDGSRVIGSTINETAEVIRNREQGVKINRVTVIGCGLIGGSFALALRRVEPGITIVGCDNSPAALNGAVRRQVIDGVDEALASGGISNSDLIYLAMPINPTIDFLRTAGEQTKVGAVITDAGSTKKEICRVARKHLPGDRIFVGGHPIAGSEHSGVAHARADLFSGAPYVLTNEAGSPCHLLERLLAEMGARVERMTPEEHDCLLAMSSHLPQLVSTALAATISMNAQVEDIERVSGPGLRDMTRLANSAWPMWRDILQTNAQNVSVAIDEFVAMLQGIRDDLLTQERSNLEMVGELFSRAHTFVGLSHDET